MRCGNFWSWGKAGRTSTRVDVEVDWLLEMEQWAGVPSALILSIEGIEKQETRSIEKMIHLRKMVNADLFVIRKGGNYCSSRTGSD